MPENLHRGLDQLALMQVKHKASGGESLDLLQACPPALPSEYPHTWLCHVQVDDYGQGMIVWPTV